MPNLKILVSESAGGKDSILSAVLRVNPNIKLIVSTTNRDIRVGEVDGVTYNFVDLETITRMINEDLFIEKREYETEKGLWIYGIPKSAIDIKSNNQYIVIVDFEGLKELKKYLDSNNITYTSYFIQASAQERLRRSINREGKMTDKQCYEIARRLLSDRDIVSPAKYYCDVVLNNETQQDFINAVIRIAGDK